MTANGDSLGGGLEQIAHNAEALQPRIDGLVEQILVPELCTIETRRVNGKDTRWRVSKGHAVLDDQSVHLIEYLPPSRHKGEDLDYALSTPTLVIEKNTRQVIAHIRQGILVGNDASLADPESEDAVYRQTEDLLERILWDSKTIAQQEALDRKSHRQRTAGRFGKILLTLAVLEGAISQTPHTISAFDKWRQNEHIRDDEKRAREAAEEQAQREAAAAKIKAFDSRFPDLEISADLSDGLPVAVPFSQEFDGTTLPPYGNSIISTHIRSYFLPKADDCETLDIDIPKDGVLRASHTGASHHIITAEQDSVANLVTVCNTTLDDGSSEEESTGRLFLELGSPTSR